MQHIDNHFGKSSDPDMERSQQLLAVSIALVTIIKNNMPYSANMDAVFSEKCNNENDKDYNEFYSILERDTKTVKSAAFSDQAQNALELGTGNCAELASCLMLLASMLDAHSLALRGDKSVYITMILIRDTSMDCHAFCLLHSSEVLAKKECFDGIASNLADLSNRTDLKDAIILDPWLNFVGTLEKVTNVINALCTIDYGISGWNEIAKIAPTYLPAFIDMISPKQVD